MLTSVFLPSFFFSSPLPTPRIGSVLDLMSKYKTCNCKRSNCLKLYCECFSFGVYCSPPYCNCVNCYNVDGRFVERRLKAVVQTVERNPNAFRSKAKGTKQAGSGCHCKKR